MRLVESVNLRIEEAALTGESVPSEKRAALTIDRDAPLGDRANTAFSGTLVANGRGAGIVIATGMRPPAYSKRCRTVPSASHTASSCVMPAHWYFSVMTPLWQLWNREEIENPLRLGFALHDDGEGGEVFA